jgi:hypothetical protein
MKATLEFNLEIHEERESHARAVKSTELLRAIHAIDQWLKQGSEQTKTTDSEVEVLIKTRRKLHEFLRGYEVMGLLP